MTLLARAADGELLLDTRMARHAAPHRPGGLAMALVLIALLAVALPTLVVVAGIGHRPYRDIVLLPRRVVPRDELPPVGPVRFVDLAPDAARAFNAGQPFSAEPVPAARPFLFAGSADDRARATDCLAAAEIYEAGDDAAGERAVAQVVLNRLRHPAFPKSVCAVVFQGSERSTGCQFTFSCDGALARWHPAEAAWHRAQAIAAAALGGTVDRQVGYATHYHTDWVVPYWQSSLDKIASVHSHLFFRWSGWWGTPPAFNRRPVGAEPVVALLAPLSDAHRAGAAGGDGDAAAMPGVPFFGRTLRPLASDPDTFLTTIDPAQPPESDRALAVQACGDRVVCKVLGWSDPSTMGFTLPLTPEAQAALSFSYLRDRVVGLERVLWNCTEFRKVPPGQCMKKPRPVTAVGGEPVAAPAPAEPNPAGPADLGGVRRKSAPVPTAPTAAAAPTA